MEESDNSIQFSLKELTILQDSIRHYNPSLDNEMLAVMIYQRITRKIEELQKKNR